MEISTIQIEYLDMNQVKYLCTNQQNYTDSSTLAREHFNMTPAFTTISFLEDDHFLKHFFATNVHVARETFYVKLWQHI